ncbi:hypothetical protein ANN_14525 [Periplaneta americana]|uniref:Uncharacterized protein n=1 Tax=Periplaneta americana TaxID=6978 RepID=A0ABQ8SX68_PERAM|nr:hypothetical protein ANN_14525 [Periplaneta americana]
MAGLCEGGNEPPGSLKASKWYSRVPVPHQVGELVGWRTVFARGIQREINQTRCAREISIHFERERGGGKNTLDVEEAASIPKAKSVLSSDNIYDSAAFLKGQSSDLPKYIEYLKSSLPQLKDATSVIDSLQKQVPGSMGEAVTLKLREVLQRNSEFEKMKNTSTGLDNVGPIRCQKENLRPITASTPPSRLLYIYGRLFPYPTTALKMTTTQRSKRQPPTPRQRGRSPEACPHIM